ncbi:MAG: diaminopimelate decarboxylase [Alphaproteobacteria bacterium]|nr:diaminopimelate decarboxylase [Alphaproteobacteria bacterium]MBF0251566.1 diaminopimelate decarboxylase [Alphaproteobacteria bacterium]
MDHFTYKSGRLHAEDVALDAIAEAVGTPVYVYSSATLMRHFTVFNIALGDLDALVCFAVKANSNQAVIRTLAGLGAGADVVSGGELQRALKAGVPASKIVFSGVGKTEGEIRAALSAGIKQINVESVPELERISAIAEHMGVTAPVALRVNPDVDAGTHEKITTGRKENKFGIEWTDAHAVYRKAASLPGVKAQGLAVHIGSQLLDLKPFRDAYVRAGDLVAMLRADGLDVEVLDIGGGLGIPYGAEDETDAPTPQDYARVIRETVGNLGVQLVLEPGRMIAGNSGVLLTTVEYVKEGSTKTFAIVDAGMNDLIRPTLYSAYHHIVPVAEPAAGAPLTELDVVGPICETGDTFAKNRRMAPVRAGDLLVLRTAGAYGAVQASTYNTRALVPEVMVMGDAFAVVRPRQSVDDIIALDRLPHWLED